MVISYLRIGRGFIGLFAIVWAVPLSDVLLEAL
jgi:hypothetical protein